MICPRCGADNDEGQFCYNCGTRLEQPRPAPPVQSPPAYDMSQAAPQPFPIQHQQAGYGNAYAPATLPNSTTATVSLILGIVAWFALPLIGAIGAVICGHIARNEIRQSGGRIGGDGMALAGLILGYLQISLVALAICGMVGFFMVFAAAV